MALMTFVGTASGATWEWSGTASSVDVFSISTDASTREIAIIGPIELPPELIGRTIVAATLEIGADRALGAELTILEVAVLESLPTQSVSSMADLNIDRTAKEVRSIRSSGDHCIPIEEIVRGWAEDPDAPLYLILGAHAARDADSPILAQRDISAGGRVRLHVRYR